MNNNRYKVSCARWERGLESAVGDWSCPWPCRDLSTSTSKAKEPGIEAIGQCTTFFNATISGVPDFRNCMLHQRLLREDMLRDTAIVAGPSNSSPSRSSPPITSDAIGPRISSRITARDPFFTANGSPPATPTQNPRPSNQSKDKRKQSLRAYASAETGISQRHSHGLSWSSTTRDSVVDNLLFSLDNLSKTPVGAEQDVEDPGIDRAKYIVPGYLMPMAAHGSTAVESSYRSAKPSSASTSYMYNNMTGSSPPVRVTHSYTTRRSISSSNNTISNTSNGERRSAQLSISSIASAETQRAATNDAAVARNSKLSEGAEPNRTEELYDSLLSTGKDNRKRRSMSMNQMFVESVFTPSGSMLDRGRPVPSVHSKYDAVPVPQDVAPEPSVAGGPRRKDNPTSTGPVYTNQASKATLRKVTTQTDLRSANAQGPLIPNVPSNVRNQASEFVRLSGMQTRPSTQGQTQRELSPAVQAPSVQSAQKQGFFRRMFGGSSRNLAQQPAQPRTVERSDSATLTLTAKDSTSAQAATAAPGDSREKEQPANTPVPLNKKSSSLFKRRKKSVQEVPPVPPPPIPSQYTVVAPRGSSPVGTSLRQALNPYLTENEKITGDLSDSQADLPLLRAHDSSTEDSDNPEMFHSGYAQRPTVALAGRDLASYSSLAEPGPGTDREISGQTRMKVKRRDPGVLDPANTSFLVDDSSRGASRLWTSEVEASSSSQAQRDDGGNVARPESHASLADRIIASSQAALEPTSIGWKPSVVDSWQQEQKPLIKPSTLSRKRSVENLQLDSAAFSSLRDKSDRASATQPTPFYSATNAAFASDVHSPVSQYHSANSSPSPEAQVANNEATVSSEWTEEGAEYRERARKIFEGDEEDIAQSEAAAWLGEKSTLSTKTLQAYLRLFDFAGVTILAALRQLCAKLLLKGETQQFDRIITALTTRWCECNANHGFKHDDVVHTICYSLILLNTDLHIADLAVRMSRSEYVKNILPSIRHIAIDIASAASADGTAKTAALSTRPTLPWSQSSGSVPQTPATPNDQVDGRRSLDQDRTQLAKRLSMRPLMSRQDTQDSDALLLSGSTALVNQPWSGNIRSWEAEVESVLKSFFVAIRNQPLPLFGAPATAPLGGERQGSLSAGGALKRTGSVISKAPSENTSFRTNSGLKSLKLGLQSKYNRSRSQLYPPSTLNSSKTSFQDDKSMWSPTQSTFSKTLTSASMQSLGQHFAGGNDYKHSIGFANALSRAIIREENATGEPDSASISVPGGLLEDEDLMLEGAPWAKEGLVKHKHHFETSGKRVKERDWMDCFAVISKGKLTLFAFGTTTKAASLGRKALTKNQAGGRAATAGARGVGGGDWMENAEQLGVFALRQTIASLLPPPGYSKTRQHVWALSLPSGDVHLFQVGTEEIAQEFMSTANYWSARLSKEPLSGGVSNVEYGWSEAVINPALADRPFTPAPTTAVGGPPVSMQNRSAGHKHSTSVSSAHRASMTSSLRTSLDTGFGGRPRLPGDKVHLAAWHPPTQSMMASQLMEVDQLKGLSAYVKNVEMELERHNELKGAIELAYTPRHANHARAMANWQRKSEHLLRESVKFQTYVDSLDAAQKAREEFYARKKLTSTDVDENELEPDGTSREGEVDSTEPPVTRILTGSDLDKEIEDDLLKADGDDESCRSAV